MSEDWGIVPESTRLMVKRWEEDQCNSGQPHWPHLWARGTDDRTHECCGQGPSERYGPMPPRVTW